MIALEMRKAADDWWPGHLPRYRSEALEETVYGACAMIASASVQK